MRTLIGRLQKALYTPPPTNRITNFRGSGAVVGTIPGSGSLPSDWEATIPAGLTLEILSIQSLLGANEITFRISGTATASGFASIRFSARNATTHATLVGEARRARMRAAGPTGWTIVYRGWNNSLIQVEALASTSLPSSIASIIGLLFVPTAATIAFATAEVRRNVALNDTIDDIVIVHIPTLSDS
jgi:hypothetical protein